MLDVVPIGMALAVVVFAVGLALEARARKQKYAAQLATPPTLPSLYPRINSDVCICSGACVTACPEGDVIAMIDGRPRLVRPSACIGHSDCLRSCPVNAIEIVLGNVDRPVEVPVASGVFETTLAGVYVAGEITGMGLIHNAVAQGRQVAATALEAGGPHDCELDLVVVGAGPAGIGAALEARRRGARFVVFEKGSFGGAIRSYPRQKIVMTAPMDLPGYGKVKLRRTSKEALLELFESVVQATQLAIAEHAEVTGIVPVGEGLRVETPHGVVTARRVVLAIGRRGTPRRLGVPGDGLPHVVYEVLDPAKHAGASVTIVGGGDSAAELALALAAQPRTRVTLVHRGPDFGRCKPDNQAALDEARAARRLSIHLGTTVRCVTPHHVELAPPGRPLIDPTGLRPAPRADPAGSPPRDSRTLIVPSSLVVCCLGAELPSPWLRSLGVSLRELRGEPVPRARRAR